MFALVTSCLKAIINSKLLNCTVLTSITNSAEICFNAFGTNYAFTKFLQKFAINSELSFKIDQKHAENSLKGKTFRKNHWPYPRNH